MAKNLFKSLFSWHMFIVLVHGFAQGLPFTLIGSTLKLWLAREDVSLTEIGLFTYVGIFSSWKFLWSPFMDHYALSKYGRRRTWLFLSQVGLTLCIAALGSMNPQTSLFAMAMLCLLINFLNATQDIAIDAYRIEILKREELGLGSSVVQYGFRISMLVAGGLGVSLVDPDTLNLSWHQLYQSMAVVMGIITAMTLFIPEPVASKTAQIKGIREAVIEPFKDFLTRDKAVYILLFVFLFKLGDAMAGAMLTPFYAKFGYTNLQIGVIAKTYGLFSSMLGLFFGGTAIFYFGVYRCLWIFGILQALSTASFLLIIYFSPAIWPLAFAVLFEDFSSGMGSAAFLAFISYMCSSRYTATQYALLSSIAVSGRIWFSGTSGFIVERIGWDAFFIVCTLLAVPGLAMLYGLRNHEHKDVG